MEITDDLILVMRERVEALIEKNDWDEAISAADSTLKTYAKKYQEDPQNHMGDFSRALEIRANLYRDSGDFTKAEEHYTQIIDLLKNDRSYPGVCGRVGANLAMIYENREQTIDAMKFYIWAIENLEVVTPPAPMELAGVMNNLAFLYEGENYLTEAEQLFTSALSLTKEELGSDHPSTASIYNNLGGLYFRDSNFEQALEMHKMALEIRREALGPDHLDTAQSHGNIALAYSELKKYDLAKDAFELSLKIMEKSTGAEVGEQYSIIGGNYSHMYKELEFDSDRTILHKRMTKHLKKMHK